MTTQIIYSDKFNKHNNKGHPENAKRLKIMMNSLKKTKFYKDIDIVETELLSEKKLYEIHSKRMINQVKEQSKKEEGWIDLDTYVSKNDFETTRLAAGGVLSACENVLKGKIENAFCMVRPPGHHATSKRSMGFCLFNNGAIAANEIAKKGKKVLIIDPDVHHGNGTQEIFYNRSDVMYQSIHLSPHFPGTGEIEEVGEGDGKGYNMNAPLSFLYGNRAAFQILNQVFLPAAEQFKPDLIIMTTGFDSHHSDLLGGLHFTADFFGKILKAYQDIQPKIVCTLEGGYNKEWIGKCFTSQIAQLMHEKIEVKDKISSKSDVTKIIKEIKENIGKYWDI